GSTVLRPGEASLAHRGVLFLDELTEFRRDAIEALRQPLEDGRIVVTRAGGSVSFPARFTLVAAANPCPCGFSGDPRRSCRCRPDQEDRYRQKLSGPLLDRIDLRLSIPRLTKDELLGASRGGRTSVRRPCRRGVVLSDGVRAGRESVACRMRSPPVSPTDSARAPGRPMPCCSFAAFSARPRVRSMRSSGERGAHPVPSPASAPGALARTTIEPSWRTPTSA